jgi:DNA mismatch repair protein MutS
MADPRDTPAMQQYYRFKKQHPECVLLFRIGDFYEMFDEDAVRVSKAIGLTLTQRTAGVPMAGVPYHQLEIYLRKLLRAGFRVAVCEQLEDSSKAKGIVQRGVTRVITPGTLVDEALLDTESAATLAAICFTETGDGSAAAIAVIDVATGTFSVTDCAPDSIVDELSRRGVREILFCEPADGSVPLRVKRVVDTLSIAPTPRPAWHFRVVEARQALLDHYGVATLAGFGIGENDTVVQPAGALIRYLRETQTGGDTPPGDSSRGRPSLKHVQPPRREEPSECCVVDAVSMRSLEIERTIRGGSLDGSLLGIFIGGRSACRTAMGKRELRDWLVRPLCDRARIEARQNMVRAFVQERELAHQVGEVLAQVQDVARICGRVSLTRATPRDLSALARSVAAAGALLASLKGARLLAAVADRLAPHSEVLTICGQTMLEALVDDPPAHTRDGGIFKDGVDAVLDEARLLQRDAGSWLASYQKQLVETHGLPGLKVGFNKIHGYYIELPAGQARNAPEALIRKQTLKSAERYMTPELREFEHKVLTAESRANERERELFSAMAEKVLGHLDVMLAYSRIVAELDALLAFAEKAHARNWVCPQIVDEPVLEVQAGRHPVLDESLAGNFVPNDLVLATRDGEAPLALITGPNMAGKSTFIRQVALIAIMAHAGSFVPAEHARIGVIDRIFTRIGADDALHAGQSTFMVEMIETANILNHATPRCLVVLDEVGRGTSTLDGLSLAWAIVEHLVARGPRTLFATHYHEITELEERFQGRLRNLHVAVREWPQGDAHAQIIFLHRILPGRTDQSYGLHVARLAGIPARVIERGREVLASLAVHHAADAIGATGTDQAAKPAAGATVRSIVALKQREEQGQMSLFTEYLPHPVVDKLRELKLDSLTPMQAFDILRGLREQAVGQ